MSESTKAARDRLFKEAQKAANEITEEAERKAVLDYSHDFVTGRGITDPRLRMLALIGMLHAVDKIAMMHSAFAEQYVAARN